MQGKHVIAELYGIEPTLLDDESALRAALNDALTAAGADVRQLVSERFTPHGVTVMALLAESHGSLHTWPERSGAFVDVFTCGDAADPVRAVELLAESLGAGHTESSVLARGGGAVEVSEPLSPGLRRIWEVQRVRWQGDTGYQRVLIADTAHGVTLFCDAERQSAETTQLAYHEALFVPAALLAARLDRVLVVGSSEGVVSQLAVAAGAGRVDHVDIDAACVRACAEHLPYGYDAAELAAAERAAARAGVAEAGDGPIRVHYTDGFGFVAEAIDAADRWDVIVVDLPDERPESDAQHNRLYGTDFLRRCAGLLAPGGVLVSQAGCPTMWRDETLRASWRCFGEVFPTAVYHGCVEHEWAFVIGCRDETAEPTRRMIDRLAGLPYRPVTLDAVGLAAAGVAPHTLREL